MKFAVVCIFFVAITASCGYFRSDKNKYSVSLQNAGSAAIKDASVIIGSDKFWFSEIAANEVVTTDLYSERSAMNDLTVIYNVNNVKKTFESAAFDAVGDYNIKLKIGSDGEIAPKICKVPCE